jgi:hypothetical protein
VFFLQSCCGKNDRQKEKSKPTRQPAPIAEPAALEGVENEQPLPLWWRLLKPEINDDRSPSLPPVPADDEGLTGWCILAPDAGVGKPVTPLRESSPVNGNQQSPRGCTLAAASASVSASALHRPAARRAPPLSPSLVHDMLRFFVPATDSVAASTGAFVPSAGARAGAPAAPQRPMSVSPSVNRGSVWPVEGPLQEDTVHGSWCSPDQQDGELPRPLQSYQLSGP